MLVRVTLVELSSRGLLARFPRIHCFVGDATCGLSSTKMEAFALDLALAGVAGPGLFPLPAGDASGLEVTFSFSEFGRS